MFEITVLLEYPFGDGRQLVLPGEIFRSGPHKRVEVAVPAPRRRLGNCRQLILGGWSEIKRIEKFRQRLLLRRSVNNSLDRLGEGSGAHCQPFLSTKCPLAQS